MCLEDTRLGLAKQHAEPIAVIDNAAPAQVLGARANRTALIFSPTTPSNSQGWIGLATSLNSLVPFATISFDQIGGSSGTLLLRVEDYGDLIIGVICVLGSGLGNNASVTEVYLNRPLTPFRVDEGK